MTGPVPTTDDVFLAGFPGGSLSILQPASGYRAGLDAVLLAAAIRIEAGAHRVGRPAMPQPDVRVLDAGGGAGVVGLCVARRLACARVTLVEKAPELVDIARRNIARNGMQARALVVAADICARPGRQELAGLEPESFDHVLANPPYLEEGRGRASTDVLKAGSHAMPAGGLDAWLRFLARLAAPGGRLVMIHRADALAELLAGLGQRFGAIEVVPLYPRRDEPAHRILVHGRKGSRAPLALHPGVVLHGDNNRFTPQIEAVLRDGAAFAP